jgi:hypothetical protein
VARFFDWISTKRDLARHDGLPGDISAPESLGEHRRETVLLIHGTFANKAVSAPAWWHPSSDFCHKLDLSLSQQGSPARCWGPGIPTNVFAWTGDNLESERRIGGDSLAKEIMDLETNHDVSCYHIVAHSHGGNVVLHALRSLAVDPKKIGAVIFLGTQSRVQGADHGTGGHERSAHCGTQNNPPMR